MDDANKKLRPITCHENLKFEEDLKITCCKYSIITTAVEQAADAGPMFTFMKKMAKELENPHYTYDSILSYLDEQITLIQTSNPSDPSRLLFLLSQEKKGFTYREGTCLGGN